MTGHYVVASGLADVRIVVRKLANGKVEFGLQQRQHDETWGDRVFPRARLFPAGAAVGRWLVSSAITLSVSESAEIFADDALEDALQRLCLDGVVASNDLVVLPVEVRRDLHVRAALPGGPIPKPTKRSLEIDSAHVARQFHRASTSSCTNCRRIVRGRAAESSK